jgi:predicted enzyme related to lactoylglutathione lyase
MENLNKARVNVMISDMDQAIAFYVDLVGLKLINRYSNHYAELDANGFMIALHPSNDSVTIGNNVSIGLGIFNFDKTIELLESRGIQFMIEKGGYIRLAHFTDPDGNCLFLAENK